jgi:hypothetical protein
MFNLRRWQRHESDLENRLRAARAEPRDEFADQLAKQVLAAGGRRSSAQAWSRLAFAAAFTTFVLGVFASVGGVGYAASGARHTYSLVSELAVKHQITVHRSAADDQYGKPPTRPTGNVAGKRVVHKTAAAAPAFSAAARTGTLPFTGFSLIGTFIASGILMCAGLLLRRRGKSDA